MALMPIGRLIGWLAAQHPDRPALTFEGRTLTRLELEQRTNPGWPAPTSTTG
jgi:hypothetical protein